MKKCNFLNPDRYEFLVWFFLGIALTTIFCFIVVVIPELKSANDILKDGIDALAIIATVFIATILTLCKTIQENKELSAKQIVIYLKRFAFILVISLIVMILWKIFHKNDNAFMLISALAILISALIASYSMLLNMENTNTNEILKRSLDYRFKMLESYIPVSETLIRLINPNLNDDDKKELESRFVLKLEESSIQFLLYGTQDEINKINKIVELSQKNSHHELINKSTKLMQDIRRKLREKLDMEQVDD